MKKKINAITAGIDTGHRFLPLPHSIPHPPAHPGQGAAGPPHLRERIYDPLRCVRQGEREAQAADEHPERHEPSRHQEAAPAVQRQQRRVDRASVGRFEERLGRREQQPGAVRRSDVQLEALPLQGLARERPLVRGRAWDRGMRACACEGRGIVACVCVCVCEAQWDGQPSPSCISGRGQTT